MKPTFFLLLALCSCSQHPPAETDERHAEAEMMRDCSNVVVGLSRIISVDYRPYGEIKDWRGEIVAEFVNTIGGVERTNLSYRFAISTNEIGSNVWTSVGLDYRWMANKEAEQQHKDFQKWLDNINGKKEE